MELKGILLDFDELGTWIKKKEPCESPFQRAICHPIGAIYHLIGSMCKNKTDASGMDRGAWPKAHLHLNFFFFNIENSPFW